MKDKIIFYAEWLPLDKKEFRILSMLADKGVFIGNLSDICRYFSLTATSQTREKLRNSINLLQSQHFIKADLKGRTYNLSLIPKESKIEIPQKWYEALLSHSYDADSVAWEMVLKTLLWVLRYSDNGEQVLTNEWIASELNTSVSTICSAKNVLEKDFEAIVRERVSIKLSEDHFMNIGQKITPCAWWDFQ